MKKKKGVRQRPSTVKVRGAYQQYKQKLADIQKRHLEEIAGTSVSDGLPESGMVELTSEMVNRGMGMKGGWNREQMILIGVDWPLKSGWRDRVVGRMIDVRDYRRFLSLKM